MNDNPQPVRLTSLSHGGGCGCKIAPGVLQQILAKTPGGLIPPQLLVGIETGDDAAVYQINREQAIVGMPVNVLPLDTIGKILQGGESVCRAAGIPIAGGHTIDCVEPIYGLVAIGLVHPEHLKRNASARPGDKLILGKPLGVGVYSAALKKEQLHPSDYEAMIATTTQLNTPGSMLACLDGVHAITDVTGFGLLGHLLEVCRGSELRATVNFADLPLLPRVAEFIEAGFATGASGRNWASYGAEVNLSADLPAWAKTLLTDPQTSGGLLVSCAPEAVTEVLSSFLQQGFGQVAVIGEVGEGSPGVDVV